MKLNGMTIRLYCTEIEIYTLTRVPVAQWLEQCVSSAKVHVLKKNKNNMYNLNKFR